MVRREACGDLYTSGVSRSSGGDGHTALSGEVVVEVLRRSSVVKFLGRSRDLRPGCS